MKKASGFLNGIAFGIFLTISLITIAVLLFISRKEDGPQTDQHNLGFIQIYDGTTIAGPEVINALRRYANRDQFGIQVITDENAAGQWYGNELNISQDVNNADYGSVITPETKVGSITQTMNVESNQYVNPNGKFKAVIVTDKTKVVRGLIFTQS